MACTSLTAFLKDCGVNIQNGLNNKTYMIAYKDLVTVSGSTEKYGTSVGGVVNVITPTGSTKFVKVEGTQKTGAIKDDFTANDNGSVTFSQEFTISLDSFSAQNKTFTENLIGQPVVILNQLKSKKWIAQGLDGTLYLKSASLAVDDSNNLRALTFSGDSTGFAPEVDATIVPSIIS